MAAWTKASDQPVRDGRLDEGVGPAVGAGEVEQAGDGHPLGAEPGAGEVEVRREGRDHEVGAVLPGVEGGALVVAGDGGILHLVVLPESLEDAAGEGRVHGGGLGQGDLHARVGLPAGDGVQQFLGGEGGVALEDGLRGLGEGEAARREDGAALPLHAQQRHGGGVDDGVGGGEGELAAPLRAQVGDGPIEQAGEGGGAALGLLVAAPGLDAPLGAPGELQDEAALGVGDLVGPSDGVVGGALEGADAEAVVAFALDAVVSVGRGGAEAGAEAAAGGGALDGVAAQLGQPRAEGLGLVGGDGVSGV